MKNWKKDQSRSVGSNERCLLTLSFEVKKNSGGETEHAFDWHILAPVKQ